MKTVQLILPPAHEGDTWRTSSVQTSASRGPARILLAPGALVMARNVKALGRTDAQARARVEARTDANRKLLNIRSSGIPCDVVSRAAWYPVRHGIPCSQSRIT